MLSFNSQTILLTVCVFVDTFFCKRLLSPTNIAIPQELLLPLLDIFCFSYKINLSFRVTLTVSNFSLLFPLKPCVFQTHFPNLATSFLSWRACPRLPLTSGFRPEESQHYFET